MDVFPTLDTLKRFIFRIVDNGGESGDRYTVITCDGDYYAMSGSPFHPQGIGMTGEGIDLQGVADRVAAGVERDLRWIDLPADCQRCVHQGLNQGFEDYIAAAPVAPSREEAYNFEGWTDFEYGTRRNRERGKGAAEAIYRDGDKFRLRRDDEPEGDPTFDTFAEAVRYMLPDEHDLAGEEYHGTRDLWNVEGGPVEPWDREKEPPVIDVENHPQFARACIMEEVTDPSAPTGFRSDKVAWFASKDDAVNYLDTDALDRDKVEAGRFTIDDLDDPDAE